MQSLVGIDIGGTNTKIGLIQYGEQFKVLKQTSILTQAQDPAEVYVKRVAQAVKELIAAAGNPAVGGVGVGCPGLIEPRQGLVRTSPNLPSFKGVKLKESLSKELAMGVEVQNDANAAVLGEWLFSPASKGVANLCMLTLGTGVGGGVIADGRLVEGADNAGTELGHLKVAWHEGALCGCGRKGCLEAYAGAGGIGRIAQEMLAHGGNSSLKPDKLTPKDIAAAAGQGDTVALQVLRKVGVYLGRGISLLIETFNPEKIVLGGGTSAAIDFLRPGIVAAVEEHASFPFTRDRVKIERSAFPDDINIIGAAATYLNAHRQGK